VWGQQPVHHEGDMKATTIWPKAGASGPEFRGNQVRHGWSRTSTSPLATRVHTRQAVMRAVLFVCCYAESVVRRQVAAGG
jgi:hypothetical protein